MKRAHMHPTEISKTALMGKHSVGQHVMPNLIEMGGFNNYPLSIASM